MKFDYKVTKFYSPSYFYTFSNLLGTLSALI
jgi:hypothetical protein